MLADALEHLVRGIVNHPEDVKVRSRSGRRADTLESFWEQKFTVETLCVVAVPFPGGSP